MARIVILVLLLINSIYGAASTQLKLGQLTINGGKYFYDVLTSKDPYIYIQLDSLSGDCDLYISESLQYPSYENYTYHSATCGTDSLIINKGHNEEIYMAVYGNPSYEMSDCLVAACSLDISQPTDDYEDHLNFLSAIDQSIIATSCLREGDFILKWPRESYSGSFAGVLNVIWNLFVSFIATLISFLTYIEEIDPEFWI